MLSRCPLYSTSHCSTSCDLNLLNFTFFPETNPFKLEFYKIDKFNAKASLKMSVFLIAHNQVSSTQVFTFFKISLEDLWISLAALFLLKPLKNFKNPCCLSIIWYIMTFIIILNWIISKPKLCIPYQSIIYYLFSKEKTIINKCNEIKLNKTNKTFKQYLYI